MLRVRTPVERFELGRERCPGVLRGKTCGGDACSLGMTQVVTGEEVRVSVVNYFCNARAPIVAWSSPEEAGEQIRDRPSRLCEASS